MALLSFHEYKAMPYPERCRHIGELLGRAAVGCFRQQRIEALARPVSPAATIKQIGFAELVSDETEKQMIRHLMLAGEATPVDFCAALQISPATAFRRLARLRAGGLVFVVGKSRAARYRLSSPSDKN